MNPKIPPLANPPATAAVLREMIALCLAADIHTIDLDMLSSIIDEYEANGWVRPKPPTETPGP